MKCNEEKKTTLRKFEVGDFPILIMMVCKYILQVALKATPY